MNSINVYSTKFSIDQYIPRHSRNNIYWDMGLQKHTTLKRTKLLKQPNICVHALVANRAMRSKVMLKTVVIHLNIYLRKIYNLFQIQQLVITYTGV